MRLLLQSSDPAHLARMATALADRGDDVQVADSLALIRNLLKNQPADGLILELTPDAVAWVTAIQSSSHPGIKAVFMTPRDSMAAAMAEFPNLSVIPTPGTALAARCLLSPDPSTDPACRLGDYQLIELEALGRRTHIFRALQRSIQRPVALRLLNQELEEDNDAVDAFLQDARAKAAVTHDRIGAVFQALEDNGAIFYTAETTDGPSLSELARSGQKLAPRPFLETVRTLASAMAHLATRELSANPIELRHIHLSGPHSTPRLANPAIHGTPEPGFHATLFLHSLAALAPMLDSAAPHSPAIAAWVETLQHQPPEAVDFSHIIAEIRHQISTLDGNHAALSPSSSAASKKRPPTLLIAGICVAAAAILGFLLRNGGDTPPPQREVPDTDATIAMPGGEFTHPSRGAITLRPFNIDKYEVTIRQYSQFLDTIGDTFPKDIQDPRQAGASPEKTNHKPVDWDIWFPIAQAGGKYQDHRLTLDCPVFNVDFWDAHAYARWKNRRLPSEDEWETVARGPGWRKFPWGSEWDANQVNGADKPAPLDGHDAWSPVDLPAGDATAQDVHGLAGNVSEWTGSDAVHPEFPDRTIPVVKGGSFSTKGDIDASTRVRVLSRNENKPWLGFRTAADL